MHLQSMLLWFLLSADASLPIKLVWVNPSRCLPVCNGTTNMPLVRVNALAVPRPRGKFQLAPDAVAPMLNLLAGGRKAGHAFGIRDSSRGYGGQAFVFRKHKEAGRAARPGHSEHELDGLAVDLVIPSIAAIAWLAEHAHEYGFTVSYPQGKQRVTGYRAEPWHIRFVGLALASELHGRGITLEEWFRENPERGISGDCGACPLPESRPQPCGAVTEAGSCRGSILTWCYDGTLAKADCSVSGERCALDAGTGNFSCLAR